MNDLFRRYYRIFEPSMPLGIFQMARCFYTQLRDGKSHVSDRKSGKMMSRLKDHDISRLPGLNAGHLDVNYSEINGGHMAYFFSSLVNTKVCRRILATLL